nr:ATP-dependent RNA helicase DEAH11, chloroplastic-like [Ipomoea batatas]
MAFLMAERVAVREAPSPSGNTAAHEGPSAVIVSDRPLPCRNSVVTTLRDPNLRLRRSLHYRSISPGVNILRPTAYNLLRVVTTSSRETPSVVYWGRRALKVSRKLSNLLINLVYGPSNKRLTTFKLGHLVKELQKRPQSSSLCDIDAMPQRYFMSKWSETLEVMEHLWRTNPIAGELLLMPSDKLE